MNATELRNKIVELTSARQAPQIDNLYKESLRSLLNIMGNLYYIDGNGNRIQVNCTHGNPERMVSRLKADNSLILPLMTLSESGTANADIRRRTNNIILSDVVWDDKKRRATRVLYVAPRPVIITYEINIWAKYKSDMDMLRSGIYSLFSPDMNVRTKFSDHNKAFVSSERDIGTFVAGDTKDRIIKKSITISLETYVPTPRFQITNTGEMSQIRFNVTVDPDTPMEAVEDVILTPDPATDAPIPVVPDYVPFAPYSFGGEEANGVSNLSPKIHYSTTLGDWPLVVQATTANSTNQPVGSTGSTADGMDNPFHQADYHWNFGDPTRTHTSSTIGMNIAPVVDSPTQWAFVDIGRHIKAWASGAGNSTDISVDSLGNISDLNDGTAITYIFNGKDAYPGGTYTVYWDGSGILDWSQDASPIAGTSSVGKQLISVSPSNGIKLEVTSIDKNDPIRNIRIIMPGVEKSGKWRSQPFHPTFLERLKHFESLRFMDWSEVNNSTQSTWASRTTLDHASQKNTYGVALEYQVKLANTLKVDPWFNVPHLADTDYITNMANLIAGSLDTGLKCHIEFSNECWNYGFAQTGWCFSGGALVYGPDLPGYNPHLADYGLSNSDQRDVRSKFYGDKCVEVYDIFETAFGGTDRIKRVMSDQRNNYLGHRAMLSNKDNYDKVDKFAVNAYIGSRVRQDFGNSEALVSAALVTTPPSVGLDTLFNWLTLSSVPDTLDQCRVSWEEVSGWGISSYNFIAYEGGDSIGAYNNNSDLEAVFVSALTDPRIIGIYHDLLAQWNASGFGTFNFFNSCMKWSNTGRWGHLQYQDEPLSAAPKHEALVRWADMQTSSAGMGMGLMYHGKTGEVMWTNDSQRGPNATHVFHQPGTYEVSVTMISQDTAGDQIFSSITSSITVTDNFSSMYFDSVNGNDSNDGLGVSAPKQSFSSIRSWVSGVEHGRRTYLARGSEWSTDDNNRVGGPGRRFVPYGSGTSPVILGTEDGLPFYHFSNSTGADLTDLAILGVTIDCQGSSNSAFFSGGETNRKGISLIDCKLSDPLSNAIDIGNDGAENVSLINCEIDHGTGGGQGFSLSMYDGEGGRAMEFASVVGGEFYGGSGENPQGYTLNHAIYPSGRRDFDLFRWIHFGSPSGPASMCINYNCQQDGPSAIEYPYYASSTTSSINNYMITDGNDFTKFRHGMDHGAGGDSLIQLGYHKNHIIQNNAFHDLNNANSDCLFGQNIRSLTIRDNIFYGLQNSITYQLDSSGVVGRVYRNSGHGHMANSTDRFWRLGARHNFPGDIAVSAYASAIDTYDPSAVSAGVEYANITVGGQPALAAGTEHPLTSNTNSISGAQWTFYDNIWHLSGGPNTHIIEYKDLDIDASSYSFSDQYYSPNAIHLGNPTPFKNRTTGAHETIDDWNALFPIPGNTYKDPEFFDPVEGDFTTSGA